MKKKLSLVLFLLLPLFLQADIFTMRIDGPIESITEEYVVDSFKKVQANPNAALVIIEIDTPGGFSTSMRTIIKEILASPVPVAVYVSPKGAQAASAGFFILIAADIACMSPGTNTGAAHPVSVTGTDIENTMKEKVTNDAVAYIKSLARSRNRNEEIAEAAVKESKSYTAEECLKDNVIEYIAENIGELIKQLDGKEITNVNGKKDNNVTLKLDNQTITPLEMSGRQKFLKTITNPNIAYFLLIFGLLGLYLEFTHPGVIIPGVVGGICLLLAFLAFQILPLNYVGLLLILLSIGFFIAEVKIQGFGMFGVGGIISFVLGSLMLINSPIPEMRPNMITIIVFALLFALVLMVLAYKVIKAMRRGAETGQEGLIGETGTTKTVVDAHSGKVFVHGEWWNAVCASEFDKAIPAGSKVRVDAIDGFVIKVSPISKNKKGGN